MTKEESKPIITSELSEDDSVEINEALNGSCGLGTLLFLIPSHLFYMFYGSEGVVMSIVGLSLRCRWKLDAFLTSFIQMEVIVVGAISLLAASGFIDNFGRKKVLLVTFTGVLVTSFMTGFFDNIWIFIILRFVMGLFIGPGTATAISYIPEIPPKRYRSYSVAMCSFSYALGTVVTCAVCYFCLNSLGWRKTIMIIPGIFSLTMPAMLISRESPRWDVNNGNMASATKSIKLLYKLNRTRFAAQLKEYDIKDSGGKENHVSLNWFLQERSRIFDLAVILILAFSTGFMFYGAVFGGPRFIIAHSNGVQEIAIEETNHCHIPDGSLFRIMITAIPEALVSFIGAVGTNRLGRRSFTLFVSLLQIITIAAFYIPFRDSHTWTLMVMFMRCAGSLSNTIVILIISEYFPTNVRSAAEYLGLMATKLSGCFAALAAQYFFDINHDFFVSFLLIFAVITFVDSLFLRETLYNENIDM